MTTEELKQENVESGKDKPEKPEKAENPFKAAARKKQQIQTKTVKEDPAEKTETEPAAESGGAGGGGAEAPAETVAAAAEDATTSSEAGSESGSSAASEGKEESRESGRKSMEEVVASYAAKVKKTEPQKERIQVATTKTIKDRLKEMERNGEIQSMNHFINFLLKQAMGMEDE